MPNAAVDELCSRAREAVGAGNYQDARTLYAQAVEAAPDSSDAHYGLATCCYLLSDFEGAKKHFREVTRLDPLRATAFINLGALYNRLGQQDEAIANLRKGLQLDPRRSEGYYNLGIAYRQKAMSDLAIQAYREATRLNPRMADAFLNLGNLLLETERYGDALAAYDQALAVRPNFDKALQGRESARRALAESAAAIEARGAAIAGAHDGPHGPEPSTNAGFANIVERAEAIDTLRDDCHRQEEACRELVRVLDQELGPALRDLSRSLVGNPAEGELELHVRAYESSIEKLRTARRDLDQGAQKISRLGGRFHAAAQATSEAVG